MTRNFGQNLIAHRCQLTNSSSSIQYKWTTSKNKWLNNWKYSKNKFLTKLYGSKHSFIRKWDVCATLLVYSWHIYDIERHKSRVIDIHKGTKWTTQNYPVWLLNFIKKNVINSWKAMQRKKWQHSNKFISQSYRLMSVHTR